MSTIRNERTKLLAGALDRASTACLTVGVFGPMAAYMYQLGDLQSGKGLWLIAIGGLTWLCGAGALHFLANRVLGSLV
jgi:hypothetical protein